VRAKRIRPSCLQDAGKGREHDRMDAGGRATQEAKAEERKLEGSPSGANGTNCIFAGNAETLVMQRNQPVSQRTRATCGLDLTNG
jgi:hypothetical protein